MIPYETKYSEAVEKRYVRLAGPFEEPTLLGGMMAFLGATGARAITVGETTGVCVWRLRSECETLEETARRLAKRKRRISP